MTSKDFLKTASPWLAVLVGLFGFIGYDRYGKVTPPTITDLIVTNGKPYRAALHDSFLAQASRIERKELTTKDAVLDAILTAKATAKATFALALDNAMDAACDKDGNIVNPSQAADVVTRAAGVFK